MQKAQCSILPDPRFKELSIENYKAKKQILDSVIAKVNQTHTAINQIRSIRKQINDFNASITKKEDRDTMIKLGKKVNDSLSAIENILVQTKAKNIQDLLNYPIKLNNKLAQLIDKIDAFKGPVPQQYWDVYKDLSQKINIQLAKFESIKSKEIKMFNTQAKKLETDVIRLNK